VNAHPSRRPPLLWPGLVLAALLAPLLGCPLPQPLAEVAPGQPITPPRIVVEDVRRQIVVTPIDTLLRVPVGCSAHPAYALQASLIDPNTTELVVARWFVNYDPASPPDYSIRHEDQISGPPTSADDLTLRQTPPYSFDPYLWPPQAGTGDGTGDSVGALHVVDLVVSNGFDASQDQTTLARPNRTPALDYEVQLYRWVFLGVPQSATAVCP